MKEQELVMLQSKAQCRRTIQYQLALANMTACQQVPHRRCIFTSVRFDWNHIWRGCSTCRISWTAAFLIQALLFSQHLAKHQRTAGNGTKDRARVHTTNKATETYKRQPRSSLQPGWQPRRMQVPTVQHSVAQKLRFLITSVFGFFQKSYA